MIYTNKMSYSLNYSLFLYFSLISNYANRNPPSEDHYWIICVAKTADSPASLPLTLIAHMASPLSRANSTPWTQITFMDVICFQHLPHYVVSWQLMFQIQNFTDSSLSALSENLTFTYINWPHYLLPHWHKLPSPTLLLLPWGLKETNTMLPNCAASSWWRLPPWNSVGSVSVYFNNWCLGTVPSVVVFQEESTLWNQLDFLQMNLKFFTRWVL